MPNRKTVDPDAVDPSVRIIGMRVTQKQINQIEDLCAVRGVKRSKLLRDILREAWDREMSPEPF